ncbi:Peptidyl-prolyl cis-trans isomerase E [Trametes pubescens]|uniref:Peptidyl-prolyl cis-trans isomerase E n=1 Tax=Trametes pubescens TaxID=154538 RepID=A0A1M2W789_TRAPU|nr:Peptidyl-prolyl cis-trans isomerase E [Trametes pubescens]
MEEGTKSKKTVFVGGIGDDVDETVILENFSPFDSKHRGFAFVTYSSAADAQDAIDNMDLNELNGRVLRVNLARPMKGPLQPQGNRAIWESEEWLQKNVKPLGESGGHALRAQTAAGGGAPGEGEAEEAHEDENAMEE